MLLMACLTFFHVFIVMLGVGRCWRGPARPSWCRPSAGRATRRRLMGEPHSSARLPKQQLVGEAIVRGPLDACGRLSGSLSLNRRDFAGPKLAIEGAMNPAWGMRSLQQLAPSQRAASGGAPTAPHAPGLLNTDSEHSISTRYIISCASIRSLTTVMPYRYSIESGFQYYASSRQQRKGRMRRHSLDSQLSFHVSDVEREAARHTIVRFAAAAAPAGGVGAPNRACVHSFSSSSIMHALYRQSRRRESLSPGGAAGWLGRRLVSGARESRRCSYTSEDSSFSSVVVTGVSVGADDTTLFSNMMRRLQLSSSAASSPCPPAAAPRASDVKEAALCSRATIGVQTSLEDQDLRFPHLSSPRHVPLVDKATQVSPNFSSHRVTPTFKPYHRSPPRLFSRQASLPSSSEDIISKDDSQSGWRNVQNYVGLQWTREQRQRRPEIRWILTWCLAWA
ncbi:uncharacterized protein LOC108680859 [Hyalella azteca]|uniref:Uncharacterized protein LOC108680859 n=1 Tax=Hyalella azteca TaxID=294128 RepID=A0A8B7PIB0_HYAAZ|nr:uncharacterized protein LOC108680859 [Hyalella azteca]